jgi:hypothetical protein
MSEAHAVHVRTQHTPRSKQINTSKPAPKRINDVVRSTAKSLVVTPRPQLIKSTAALKPAHVSTAKPTPAGHAKAHKPQPARTLMRAAVKRPDPSLRRQVHAQTRTDILVKTPQLLVEPKYSVATIDEQRQQRAEHVSKSKFIRRFAPDQASWFRQQVTPAAATPSTTKPAQSAPAPGHNRSMDVFQRALATATAHEQPAVHPKKHARKASRQTRVHHRLTSVVTMSLAVVVLAGFFAYQNKAAITLRFASAKAGFHATLPSNQPSGFAAGKFRYSAGQVAVQYVKPGTSRNYTLSQKRTSLTAQNVLTANAVPHSGTYQTLQQGGNTVYIYGNGNAAWVSDGIFYQITSDGNLSTADILSIATSV